MGILREITRLPDAIHRLAVAIHALSDVQAQNAPGTERLDELERNRAIWEAEVEAGLLKADSKYKAAAAAESRAKRQVDKLDPFAEEGDQEPDGIPAEYVGFGENETLQPVRPDLGLLSPKQLALRMKFS